jgi:hypothetical protein
VPIATAMNEGVVVGATSVEGREILAFEISHPERFSLGRAKAEVAKANERSVVANISIFFCVKKVCVEKYWG